jgi:SAM-dependent methyltransferase
MTAFDDLTDAYEALVDWPKRLDHEAPFYRRWFSRAGVRRVVDVACGVGRHAAMFHSWGLTVEAADLSPNMLARARAAFGEPAGLRWVERSFDAPVWPAEPFDAAVCVGNSLALAADKAAAGKALSEMLAALRPGGLVIIQVLNLWRVPDGPCAWQKCVRAALPQGEALILKGVHRCGGRGYVNLVVVSWPEGKLLQAESAPLLGFEAAALSETALAAGAAQAMLFGGFGEQPYEREQSADLLLVAIK